MRVEPPDHRKAMAALWTTLGTRRQAAEVGRQRPGVETARRPLCPHPLGARGRPTAIWWAPWPSCSTR